MKKDNSSELCLYMKVGGGGDNAFIMSMYARGGGMKLHGGNQVYMSRGGGNWFTA